MTRIHNKCKGRLCQYTTIICSTLCDVMKCWHRFINCITA